MSARRSSGAKRPASAKKGRTKRTTTTGRRGRRPRAKGGDPARIAAELVHTILAQEGVAHAEVGLAHGGDALTRVLNKKYRGMDKATDILSFTYEDGKDANGHRVLFGDLVISVPRLLAQARRYRVTPGRELARMLTHGALHLCGHDHVKLGERKRMRARERVHMATVNGVSEKALTRLVQSWEREPS
ncbi:MAG TPA: rRNA maturation RNase YbeY [Candidatus Eisenbacteria bacterium]|nr:rRNA maturation RNase YbeY [Candidatus Eisenbacteria bacterium]